MVKGKKSFIDRKNAVTFHLVHRSQHDPLVADNTAPQHVLLEASSHNQSKKGLDQLNSTKQREEQQKYGIFFDDDYDYLQHLKKPDQSIVWEYVENPNQTRKRLEEGQTSKAPKLALPSSVFASEFQEEEGMLNKAARHSGPRPDWDHEVVAALDDDFDYEKEENLMEDDFVIKAMAESDEISTTDNLSISSDNLDDSHSESDHLGPLVNFKHFNEEETKSRFTEYSMSSSVIRRNENLSLLDDRFDRFYATYDDSELGDLACEDIEGTWHQKHPVVLGCYKEHKKGKHLEKYNKEWDCERLPQYRNIVEGEEDPDEELVELEIKNVKEKKWDCESILSKYSNLYNHPKVIGEPQYKKPKNTIRELEGTDNKIEINNKLGLPINVLRNADGLTKKTLANLDVEEAKSAPKSLCNKSLVSTLSILSIRPKDESPDEKRERKRLLREYRNERRVEKKANADAFKEEKKRQTHVKINKMCNQQGNKIF